MNTPSDPNASTIECYNCGTSFERKDKDGRPRLSWPIYCEPCQARYDAEGIEERRKQFAAKLAETKAKIDFELERDTPPRFRQTDISDPRFNSKLWNRVKSWRPTNEMPWLGLIGDSGKSKTRCGYLLVRDLVMESINQDEYGNVRSADYETVSSYQISTAILGQYSDESQKDAKDFLRRLQRVPILFLDDFGKSKNTPSFNSTIFDILDRRHANNLTTIWSANLTPEGIVAGMPPDFAGPLAGRIRESSTIISIK